MNLGREADHFNANGQYTGSAVTIGVYYYDFREDGTYLSVFDRFDRGSHSAHSEGTGTYALGYISQDGTFTNFLDARARHVESGILKLVLVRKGDSTLTYNVTEAGGSPRWTQMKLLDAKYPYAPASLIYSEEYTRVDRLPDFAWKAAHE